MLAIPFYRVANEINQMNYDKNDREHLASDKQILLERIDKNYEQVSGEKSIFREGANQSKEISSTEPEKELSPERLHLFPSDGTLTKELRLEHFSKEEIRKEKIKKREAFHNAIDSLERQAWVQELRVLKDVYGSIVGEEYHTRNENIDKLKKELLHILEEIKNRPHREQSKIVNQYFSNYQSELTPFAKQLFIAYMKGGYNEKNAIENWTFHTSEIDEFIAKNPIIEEFIGAVQEAKTSFDRETQVLTDNANGEFASKKTQEEQNATYNITKRSNEEMGEDNIKKMQDLEERYTTEYGKLFNMIYLNL